MEKQNIEDIRRKNIEDNQIFLEQLRLNDIRNDFIQSARSMIPKREYNKKPVESIRIEYATRYKEKVKSGEIPEYVPQWKRTVQRRIVIKDENERLRLEKLARSEERRKWTLFFHKNARPYERIFKPRHTRTSERVEQEISNSLEEK